MQGTQHVPRARVGELIISTRVWGEVCPRVTDHIPGLWISSPSWTFILGWVTLAQFRTCVQEVLNLIGSAGAQRTRLWAQGLAVQGQVPFRDLSTI